MDKDRHAAAAGVTEDVRFQDQRLQPVRTLTGKDAFFRMLFQPADPAMSWTFDPESATLFNAAPDLWSVDISACQKLSGQTRPTAISLLCRKENAGFKICSVHLACPQDSPQAPAFSGQPPSTSDRNATAQIRDIFDHLPGGIGVYRYKDGDITPVLQNKGYWDLFGQNDPRTQSLDFHQAYNAVHPDDRDGVRSRVRQMVSREGSVSALYRVFSHPRNHYFWLRADAASVRQSDGAMLCYVNFTDVTRQISAEYRVEGILNTIPGGVACYTFEASGAFTCLYVSDGVPAIAGFTPEEYRSETEKDLLNRINPNDFSNVKASMLKAKQTGQVTSVNYRVIHKNGAAVWVNLSAKFKKDENGQDIVWCTFTQASHTFEIQRNIIDESDIAIAVVNPDTLTLQYINRTCSSTWQCSQKKAEGQHCYEILYHSKRPCIDCPLENEASPNGITTRFIAPMNRTFRVKYVSSQWMGRPAIIIYYTDMTTELQTRELLQKEKERYRIIVERGGIALCDCDYEKKTLYANDSFSRYALTTCSMDKLIEQLQSDQNPTVVHPDDLSFLKQFHKAFRDNHLSFNETCVRLLMADGRYHWTDIEGFFMYDKTGKRTRSIATLRDVNETTRYQKELESFLATLVYEMGAFMWIFDLKSQTIIRRYGSGMRFESGLDVPFTKNKDASDVMICHPDDIVTLRDLHRQIEKGKKRVSAELRFRRNTSTQYFWVRCILVAYSNEFGQDTMALGIGIDISEEKKYEQQYQQELRLRQSGKKDYLSFMYYNVTRDCVVEHESGNNLPIPPGQSLQDYIDTLAKNRVLSPGDHKIINLFRKESLLSAFIKGEIPTIEYQNTMASDSPAPPFARWHQTTVHLTRKPDSGDIIAFIYTYDIDDQKQMADALTLIARSAYDYIALIDLDQDTLRFLAAPQIGYPVNHPCCYSKFCDHFIKEISDPVEQLKIKTASSTDNIRKQLETKTFLEYTFKGTHHGQRIMKQIRFRPFGQGNSRVLTSRTDISDLTARQEAQQEALQQALNQAQAATAAKSNFLSRMSHDMRTPMNGILGLTELMRDKQHGSDLQSDLDQLEISGRYLLTLINDTLDMSKIENNVLELHPSVFKGIQIFQSLVALTRPNLKKKHIHLEIHADNLPFTYLYIDAGRLQQIFMNIMSNAIKFTPEGGRIDFYMRNIKKTDGVLTDEIIVEDTGVGMAPDFIPHIFESFSQEKNNAASGFQGTGLGMSIVKHLVELMGGEISVTSQLGAGTRVRLTVELPVATADQIESFHQSQIQTPTVDLRILNGKHILICEDHPLNAEIARRLLEKQGITTEIATDGEKGVARFKAKAPGTFDAILMDIRMPNMDGLTAAKTIRSLKRPDAKTLPIIAMTANAFDTDVSQSLVSGMDAHIAKPVDAQKLYETLAALIRDAQK